MRRGDEAGFLRTKAAVMRQLRPLFWRSLLRHPDDLKTVVDAGRGIFGFCPQDRPRMMEIWVSFLRRHPESQEVRELIQLARANESQPR